MEQLIDKIISELYALDPELRKQDAQLRKIISELLQAKPEVKINEEFVKGLKSKLQAKASLINKEENSMKNILNYILGGALTVAVAVAVFGYYNNNLLVLPKGATEVLTSKIEISEVPNSNSFGSLAMEMDTMSRNQSGGGGGSAAQLAFGVGGGGGDAKIIPPAYNYKYVYTGDKLPELSQSQDVLKRITETSNKSGVSEFIKKFSFGLINISKFNQAELQNFNLIENKEFGYGVSVDLTQGSVSLYQNWEKWPHPEAQCQNEECFKQYRLSINDVPEDSVVIDIAKNFLKEYGVSLANYGEPVVFKDWMPDYARSSNKADYYIPDSVSITFPLVIKDKAVLDEAGNPSGISVTVDIRNKKVSGVYGLFTRKYEQSKYEGETDSGRIIKIAENGGFRNYMPYYQEGGKDITIDLGTPKEELVQIWQYSSGTQKELYVPALVFPVKPTENATEMYLPKFIVVPLVKELLTDPVTQATPMPIDIMVEPAATK